MDTRCGVHLARNTNGAAPNLLLVKGTRATYLLWFLGGFGILGLHRLYLGRWVTFLIWLATGGVFLVGALADLFLIPGMVQVENLARQLVRQARRGGLAPAGGPAARPS